MAAPVAAIRQVVSRSSPSALLRSVRLMATSSPPPPHEFSRQSDFLGSWDPSSSTSSSSSSDPSSSSSSSSSSDPSSSSSSSSDPLGLALLQWDYEKQLHDLRKKYIYELELQRKDKVLKDEAKREAIGLAREERKASKSAIDQSLAAEHKIIEDGFRQTLLKERSEKLEVWKAREDMMEQKRNDKNELLHQQSSMCVDENDSEKKISEAFVDTTSL